MDTTKECLGFTDNGMRRSPTPCMNKPGADGYCHVHRPGAEEQRRAAKEAADESAREVRKARATRVLARLHPAKQEEMKGLVRMLLSKNNEDDLHKLLDAHHGMHREA